MAETSEAAVTQTRRFPESQDNAPFTGSVLLLYHRYSQQVQLKVQSLIFSCSPPSLSFQLTIYCNVETPDIYGTTSSTQFHIFFTPKINHTTKLRILHFWHHSYEKMHCYAMYDMQYSQKNDIICNTKV